jgi:multiple sugar transport system permease protein
MTRARIRRDIYKWLVIVVLLLWTLSPLYWSLRLALSLPVEIAAFPPRPFPQNPTPVAFVTILGFPYTSPSGEHYLPAGRAPQVVRGLKNSIIVSAIVTLVTMVIVIPLAYTFGRLDFPHKNRLFFALLFSVALPPISVIIPFYVLYLRIGLAGTRLGLILVTLVLTVPLVTWMMIGYFRGIPNVERLARIDGFSRLGTLIRIIIPMSKTGIMVASIISFLFAWNEFTFSQILVNGTAASTIPPVISGFLFMHPEVNSLLATVFLSLIPPFTVAYLLQRHIAKMNIVETIMG